MPNEYVNKVVFNNQTLLDLTGDSVEPNVVLAGETFHDRSGAPGVGALITHDVYDGLDSTSTDDALSANMGKSLKTSINNVNSSKPNYHSIQIPKGESRTLTRTLGVCLIFGCQVQSTYTLLDVFVQQTGSTRHLGSITTCAYAANSSSLTITNSGANTVILGVLC